MVLEAAQEAGLRYVSDAMPGITRRRAGSGFTYVRADGTRVADRATLLRIRSLAIPPAYERVWISPDPNGHLQATGIDARGRKQYRYHTKFREIRDADKFKRMLVFGKSLKELRARVDEDLSLRGLPRRKVLAVVVYLLEHSLIRVGNREYAEQNKSFGLTTLRNRHVKIQGANIEFNFLGKSRIQHRIEIHDRRLARVIKRLQDLPGQDLFRYVDDEGAPSSISSADVNTYLQEISGEHFTAKDFRTWWGTLLALIELGNLATPATKGGSKQAVMSVMKLVAKQLGNTPSVCRKCYVHPLVVKAFQEGSLAHLLGTNSETVEDMVISAESTLINLLRQADAEHAQAA